MSLLSDTLERHLRQLQNPVKSQVSVPVTPKDPTLYRSVSLAYNEGSSDKVYHVQILESMPGLCCVNFQYGRRGGALTLGSKTPDGPVTLYEADHIFRKLVQEKVSKGYREIP